MPFEHVQQRLGRTFSALKDVNLRARVFVPVFGVACLLGLAYVFARPAVYVSTARLQIEDPRSQRAADKGDVTPGMLVVAQTLTSSAVLDDVARRMPGAAGSVDLLRSMLTTTPVPGTNVVEIQAEGPRPETLPRLLDAWVEAYRQRQAATHDGTARAALQDARAAVEDLGAQVSAKRAELEQFRKRSEIVSAERGDNLAVARLKGLNASLADARTREVNAEARLNAIMENLASGKDVMSPADRANLVGLERRASELRERMKELEHEYTQSYLALDPRYRGWYANLTRIEQDIERQRKLSGERQVQNAEEELATARQTVLRLQHELAARRREVQEFTSRFAEHGALAAELKRLEETYDAGKQRLAQLQTDSRLAGPAVTVLAQPTYPKSPERPHYLRDAMIAIAGAGLLGLVAVWFVEFFQRSGAPQEIELLARQPMIHIAYSPNAMPALGGPVPGYAYAAPQLPEAIAVPHLPRELTVPELHALWGAATDQARLVVAALFNGLTIEEVSALRSEHIDSSAESIEIPGGGGPRVALREPLKGLLAKRRSDGDAPWPLADSTIAATEVDQLEGLVACAAVDASIANPDEVTSAVLRHTYVAYLVRQGARLSEVGGMVRHMTPARLREYGRLSPSGPGLPLAQIDPVHPALRAAA